MSILHSLLRLHARFFPLHRRTVRFMESMYKRGYIAGEVDSVTNFGARMSLDLSQFVQRFIYFVGAFDINVLRLMDSLNDASHVRVMVDVGANVGHHSLFGALKLKTQKIISFEPDKDTFTRLKKNILLNNLESVIEIGNFAVSDTESYVTIAKPEKNNDGMNYMVEAISKNNEESVKTVVLDSFCADHNIEHIDLLKIDVEGAEAKVLKGLHNMLRDGRISTIFIEICEAHLQRFGNHSSEIIDALEEAGFVGFVIDGWKLIRLNKLEVPDYCDAVFVKDNLFAKMSQIGSNAGFTVHN